jgi:hypothetical protein
VAINIGVVVAAAVWDIGSGDALYLKPCRERVDLVSMLRPRTNMTRDSGQ